MKSKIKKNKKMVTMYLTEEEYDVLDKETNKRNMSFTEWLKEATEMKLRNDNDDLKVRSDKLLKYFQKRIDELTEEEEKEKSNSRPDVLDVLYAKAAEFKKNPPKRFQGFDEKL